MRYTKWIASMALAGGMALLSTGAASAQEWRYRHMDNNSARISEMRNHIARDRARLNEDIRRGRRAAADRDRAQLRQDERLLEQMRDGYRR